MEEQAFNTSDKVIRAPLSRLREINVSKGFCLSRTLNLSKYLVTSTGGDLW
jgi:hypothetical protein